MKENKYFTRVNFFLPFAYVMILGFFFTEKTDKVSDHTYSLHGRVSAHAAMGSRINPSWWTLYTFLIKLSFSSMGQDKATETNKKVTYETVA